VSVFISFPFLYLFPHVKISSAVCNIVYGRLVIWMSLSNLSLSFGTSSISLLVVILVLTWLRQLDPMSLV
jgi:hypothetical protein